MFKFKNNILTLGASDVYIFNNLLRIKGVYVYGGRAGQQEKEGMGKHREYEYIGHIASQGLWSSPLPPAPFLLYLSLWLHEKELRLHLKGPHSLRNRARPQFDIKNDKRENIVKCSLCIHTDAHPSLYVSPDSQVSQADVCYLHRPAACCRAWVNIVPFGGGREDNRAARDLPCGTSPSPLRLVLTSLIPTGEACTAPLLFPPRLLGNLGGGRDSTPSPLQLQGE